MRSLRLSFVNIFHHSSVHPGYVFRNFNRDLRIYYEGKERDAS